MRHLRRTVLAALAVALCAAPATAAHPHNDHGHATISLARGGGLTGGELLGEALARSLTGSNRPFRGTCTTLARNVLQAHGGADGTATCTATPRSRLFVTFGSWCWNIEEPFPETEEEELACAIARDRGFFEELNVTVDGDTINIIKRRFELFSPQRTIELPADNPFGLPAQTATVTGHGWGVVVHSLRPGRHTVTLEVVTADFRELFITVFLNVVRGGHSDNGDHDDHGDD